jgi:hypothetical protein
VLRICVKRTLLLRLLKHHHDLVNVLSSSLFNCLINRVIWTSIVKYLVFRTVLFSLGHSLSSYLLENLKIGWNISDFFMVGKRFWSIRIFSLLTLYALSGFKECVCYNYGRWLLFVVNYIFAGAGYNNCGSHSFRFLKELFFFNFCLMISFNRRNLTQFAFSWPVPNYDQVRYWTVCFYFVRLVDSLRRISSKHQFHVQQSQLQAFGYNNCRFIIRCAWDKIIPGR